MTRLDETRTLKMTRLGEARTLKMSRPDEARTLKIPNTEVSGHTKATARAEVSVHANKKTLAEV